MKTYFRCRSYARLPGHSLFRPRVQQMNPLFEQTPTFSQIGRRFCFQDELNFLRNVSNVCDLQRQSHAAAGSHRVDRHWEFRFSSIDNRLLEKNRFPTIRRFHFAVRPFCNEQIGVDRNSDAFQLARFVKSVEELSK